MFGETLGCRLRKRKLMPALISWALKLALDAYVVGVAVVKFSAYEPNAR